MQSINIDFIRCESKVKNVKQKFHYNDILLSGVDLGFTRAPFFRMNPFLLAIVFLTIKWKKSVSAITLLFSFFILCFAS